MCIFLIVFVAFFMAVVLVAFSVATPRDKETKQTITRS